MPKTSKNTVSLSKNEFQSSIQRLLNFSSVESKIVEMYFDTQSLNIQASAVTFGLSGKEKITCAADEEMNIAVNAQSLLNILKSRKTDTIELCFSAPDRPLVIRGSDNVTSVLMPFIFL